MNSSLRNLLGLTLLVAPLAAGCASRKAPFDQMDQAQITIMKLQQPAPPPVAVMPGQTPGGIPGIPGLEQLGQQAAQAAQAAGIPIPPGLIPGVGTPQQPPPMQQPQLPMFGSSGMAIAATMTLSDSDLRDELLDMYGDEDSFQPGNMGCNQAPGMGISMARGGQPPIDLVVSFTCRRTQMIGPGWPHKNDGLSNDANTTLTKIYQQLFGQQPPPGA
jgi:hypothetical protein